MSGNKPKDSKSRVNLDQLPTFHLSDTGDILNFRELVNVVLKANQVIMEIYKSKSSEWNIEYKNGHEPLTEADRSANAVICEGLARICSGRIPIISEENSNAPWDIRSKYKYCWLVDPLDGTKEFIKRNGEFTVNIGLCRGHECILGIVSIPTEGCIFFAAEGIGSFKMCSEGLCTPIRARSFSENDEALVVVTSSSHSSYQTKCFLKNLNNPVIKSYGSSLKFLLIAEGKADVYPRFVPSNEWDTCASHAVLKYAGGEVLQVDGGASADIGRPLIYNKEDLLNPFFVAFGKITESNSSGSNASARSIPFVKSCT